MKKNSQAKKSILILIPAGLAIGGVLLVQEPPSQERASVIYEQAAPSLDGTLNEPTPTDEPRTAPDLIGLASELNKQINHAEQEITEINRELKFTRLQLEEAQSTLDELEDLDADFDDGHISSQEYQEMRFELLTRLL